MFSIGYFRPRDVICGVLIDQTRLLRFVTLVHLPSFIKFGLNYDLLYYSSSIFLTGNMLYYEEDFQVEWRLRLCLHPIVFKF